jgi:hypothetical protein
MLKKETKYILKWAKRIKAINFLGGKCEECGETNIHTLDFHHKNPENKEFQISLVGVHRRWSTIEKEIKKCILLCRNCHIKKQQKKETRQSKRRIKIKQQLLEYKGSFKCSECNNEDLTGMSFDFHHIRNKEFCISDEVRRSTGYNTKQDYSLTDRMLNELDKCIILCRNCHVMKHTNMELFNRLKSKIYEKVESMKENQKLDIDQIMSLRSEGLSAQKIANRLGCKKSSVEYYLYHKKHH